MHAATYFREQSIRRLNIPFHADDSNAYQHLSRADFLEMTEYNPTLPKPLEAGPAQKKSAPRRTKAFSAPISTPSDRSALPAKLIRDIKLAGAQAKVELIKLSTSHCHEFLSEPEFIRSLKHIVTVESAQIPINSRYLLYATKKLLEGVSIIDVEFSPSNHSFDKKRVETFTRVKYVLSNLFNRLVELELCFSKRD